METLRQKLYANSPYDLATPEDDAYRNGVDETIEAVQNLIFENYQELNEA